MRLRLGIDERIPLGDMKAALDAALEASTAAQVPLIRAGRVPRFEEGLRLRGLKWRPEPPGDEHFDSAQTVLLRGWGDCDDLAPWHAASRRADGSDPGARAFVKRSGPHRWHALVRLSDGTIEDPSVWAGMRKRSASNVVGALPAAWSPMFPGRAGVAVHPWHGGHVARAEIPDISLPMTWSSIYTAGEPDDACAGAVCGVLDAVECAGLAEQVDLDRMGALADLLDGADPYEVEDAIAAVYGEAVGFLPALLPAAAALAPSAISLAKGLIPGGKKRGGGGAPPPAAPEASRSLAQAPSPTMPGTTMVMPGGTTIVRF